jgi:RND family efflux transporter MFP subunit
MVQGGPPEGGHYGYPAKAGRHARWLWSPVLGGLCLAIAVSACRRDTPRAVERQDTVVPVGAVAAQRAAIRAVLHVSGIVVPAQGGEFLLFAPEPTRLVDVMKAAGDMVKSGDILARFDLASAAQNVSRLSADLAAAEAQLESTRVNRERVRGFVDRGLVARRDLDAAERDFVDAQESVSRARAALAAAQAGAGRAVVRAPFDGIVVSRAHNPGDMVVSTTDPILRIVDPRRLEVIASIPRPDQSRVVTGATARVAAGGTEQVRLTVVGRADLSTALPAGANATAGATANSQASAATPDSTTDAVAFRLVFAEPSKLAVDMPVQLDIDAEERSDTVLIPTEAIVRDGKEAAVFVAVEARAERRRVKTGIEDAARTEITEGVRAGELVITRGHVGLTDGAVITVATDR